MEKRKFSWVLMGLSLLFVVKGVLAQEIKPSEWEIRFSRQNIAKEDTITLYLIGKIPNHQAVYATHFNCDIGPIPSKLVFSNPGEGYQLLDSAKSIGAIEEFDPIFECSIWKFKDIALIKQRIQLKSEETEMKGYLEYQTCTEDKCLQYRVYFETKGLKLIKLENGR